MIGNLVTKQLLWEARYISIFTFSSQAGSQEAFLDGELSKNVGQPLADEEKILETTLAKML